MDSEVKWGIVAICLLFLSLFAGLGFSEYQNNQCRMEAIRMGIDAKLIKELCK